MVVAGVGIVAVRTLPHYGYWTSFDPVSPGPCTAVGAVAGPEDLALDPTTGLVYVASLDRPPSAPDPGPEGGLFVYDPAAGAAGLRALPVTGVDELRPHGLDLWRDPDGSLTLATIDSRTPDDPTVLLFDVREEAGAPVGLELRTRVTDPSIRHPNDVALLDRASFFVSNDHGARGPQRLLEQFFAVGWSNVVRWDGEKAATVARHVAFANGVAMADGGRRLVVAATLGRELRVYELGEDGRPRRERTIDLGFNPDNLSLTGDGTVLVAGHQRFLDLDAHRRDRDHRSPSIVAEVDLDGGDPRVVYADDGAQLSGSSVAVAVGGHLLIGAVYASSFLDCTVDPTAPPSSDAPSATRAPGSTWSGTP